MDKIYKLLDTYIDVSKISSINIDVCFSNGEFFIFLNGLKTYIGNTINFEKYGEYQILSTDCFRKFNDKRTKAEIDLINFKCDNIKTDWIKNVKVKCESFLEYWKTYHKQESSKEYVRDH